MSVNNHRPHLLVIPEDDANRQLANGFVLEVTHDRRIQVLPEAGGWMRVVESFLQNQPQSMFSFPARHVLLLLDFDDDPGRRSFIETKLPGGLINRVFILGVLTEPEALRRAGLGSYEKIGQRLGKECREARQELWRHDLLAQNKAELDRLQSSVRPFLFQPD